MPSHLTRHVINCIISNEPIVYRGCVRRQAYSSLSRWHQRPSTRLPRSLARRAAPQQSSAARTFFDFGFGKNKKVLYDDPSLAPGVELMQSLVKRQRIRARLIPANEVEKALDAFLKYMVNIPDRPLPDTQASLVLNAMRYIIQNRDLNLIEADETAIQTHNEKIMNKIWPISKLLKRESKHDTSVHLELARFVYDQAQQLGIPEWKLDNTYKALLSKLCSLGHALEAQALWFDAANAIISTANSSDKFVPSDEEENNTEIMNRGERVKVYHTLKLCNALAREGHEAELLRTVEFTKANGLDVFDHGRLNGVVVTFYAMNGDVTSMKKWLELWLADLQNYIHRTNIIVVAIANVARAVSDCCYQAGEIEIGHAYLKRISERCPFVAVLNEVLAWNLSVHKSTEQIDNMLAAMEQNISYNDTARPNTSSINRLIEVAIADKNPYMAEKIINIGRKRGIHPDARTLTLQMDYRLSVNDVDGALVSYQHLIMQDLSKNEDVPAINRLIVALCASKRHDFDTIMNVAADLSDRRVGFEPLTVEKLCLLHLRRDEMVDVEDLIKTHASTFTSEERKSLRSAILEFCIDSKTPVANTWDTYGLLRESFDEMPREERVQIIQALFERERPDMVAHVFAHMRQHSRQDTVPDVEAYVVTLLGCAQTQDQETLQVIHNQLKLDTNIDVNTRLRNALMIAYASCHNPGQALSIWDDIVVSREGPTYNSLIIAFQTCEGMPWGDVKAQQIWSRLRKNKVSLNKRLWTAYLAALASNGNIELAVSTVEDAARRKELEVDELVIAALWHAASREMKHGQMRKWIEATYPQVWESLQQITEQSAGEEIGMEKLHTIDLQRKLLP